jgi:hypothetical protein
MDQEALANQMGTFAPAIQNFGAASDPLTLD